LERVIWYLKEKDAGKKKRSWSELRLAVMNTIGTSVQCYKDNKKSLVFLKWIKPLPGKRGFLLTDDASDGRAEIINFDVPGRDRPDDDKDDDVLGDDRTLTSEEEILKRIEQKNADEGQEQKSKYEKGLWVY